MAAKSWREQGNAFYTSALENVPALIKITRFKKAIVAYNNSLMASISNDDKASAYKNLAVAHVKLAPLEDTQAMSVFQFTESIQNFCKARTAGLATKGSDWLTGLKSAYADSVKAMINYCRQLEPIEGIKQLKNYAECLARDEAYSDLMKAVFYIQLGVCNRQINCKLFPSAQSSIQDCLYSLEEHRMYSLDGSSEFYQENFAKLHNKINICTAYTAHRRGEEYLSSLGDGRGFVMSDLFIDLVFLCLDSFKEVECTVRGQMYELEAISAYKLGFLFLKFLKNKRKASEYLRKAINLCRDFPDSSDLLALKGEATRELEVAERPDQSDTDRWYKAKRKFQTDYKTQLEELETKLQASTQAYLHFIYTNFPPKSINSTISELDHTNLEAYLKKAILHYHSDKQMSYPLEWQFLCEAITMGLTKKYEEFKSNRSY